MVLKKIPPLKVLLEVKSPWGVSFDPKWGDPKEVTFHKLEDWLLKKELWTSGKYTFTTAQFYKQDSELLKSGLIGPVRIIVNSHTFDEN